MYDELVKRMREAAEYVPCIMDREDAIKAADAIEELTRIVKEYQKFDGFLAAHGMFEPPKEGET